MISQRRIGRSVRRRGNVERKDTGDRGNEEGQQFCLIKVTGVVCGGYAVVELKRFHLFYEQITLNVLQSGGKSIHREGGVLVKNLDWVEKKQNSICGGRT